MAVERKSARWRTSSGKFLKVNIDIKLSKYYSWYMKTVSITLKAHKQIAKLSKHDMGAIYEALEALANWPETTGVRALTDISGYRLRVGRYRAFFGVAGDEITVTEVKIRNERTY